jgi:stage II sporulation protein AA (anti-sigma F factor antagonist)
MGWYKNMVLNQKKENGITVIQFRGELDDHTANQAKERLDEIMLDVTNINYIFDFDGLDFMDSSGIGMLLGRYKNVKGNGGNIFVRNVNDHIDKVFKVSGLYQVLIKIED